MDALVLPGRVDVPHRGLGCRSRAALTYRVARLVKIVLEADTAFIAGEIDDTANGFLGWYGVRFTSRNIGVDLGFAKPICDGCEDGLVMGFPFVSFTYRAFKGD
ncbi:MAG: hypothetical protein M3680_05110 [Myxococcota bacterium]|nr:hypothetical protein [Myxococcota bacterium]